MFAPATGAVLALILLTRPILVHQALTANVDVPFLALVLAAATLEAARPRRGLPVLALLAVAGLLRPEAWLLSAAYLVWLWPATHGRQRAAAVAVALSAPVLWGLFDLVAAGDPLHSLIGTHRAATRIGRPQGIDRAVRLTPEYGRQVPAGHPHAHRGFSAAAAALRWGPAGAALLPVAIAAVGVAAFLVLGLGRQPLLARYLAVPGAMLALFCAAAVTAWLDPRRAPPAGPRAAVVSVAALGGAGAWPRSDVVPTVRDERRLRERAPPRRR